MGFVRDTLVDGRAFRGFTVVDDFTRECAVIEVDTRFGGERVIAMLERLAGTRGLPTTLVWNDEWEFTSRTLNAWAYNHGVQLPFIRPGNRRRKPGENSNMESCNGRPRADDGGEIGALAGTLALGGMKMDRVIRPERSGDQATEPREPCSFRQPNRRPICPQ